MARFMARFMARLVARLMTRLMTRLMAGSHDAIPPAFPAVLQCAQGEEPEHDPKKACPGCELGSSPVKWSGNRSSLKRLSCGKNIERSKDFSQAGKRTGRPKAAGQVKIGTRFQPM
jgi:hypothetical protein